MKQKPWDNEERHRYYGLRIGDTVSITMGWPKKKYLAEVVDYGHGDNNRVYIKIEGSEEVTDWVAEWCEIVTKVEDKVKENEKG